LSGAATYLYRDDPRYWYATQPTVTKLAEDRAEQLTRNPDKVALELDARLRADLRKMGDFARIHALPRSSADVPDDLDARLVVLLAEHPYSRESGNAAETTARAILETRGHTPRLYRNTLVFLAADKVRLQDLDEALRKFLAWESILDEKESLNLDPHQVRQAERQKQDADGTVMARLPEVYQWLLVPEQVNPQAAITWQAMRGGRTVPRLARRAERLDPRPRRARAAREVRRCASATRRRDAAGPRGYCHDHRWRRQRDRWHHDGRRHGHDDAPGTCCCAEAPPLPRQRDA
jgi:hypothetical protein